MKPVFKTKHKIVEVTSLPNCDLCHLIGETRPAHYDAKLPSRGYWANVCRCHFEREECELGLGKGQMLVKVTKAVVNV